MSPEVSEALANRFKIEAVELIDALRQRFIDLGGTEQTFYRCLTMEALLLAACAHDGTMWAFHQMASKAIASVQTGSAE